MKLTINARLDYQFDEPTDILLQVEAAKIPGQLVTNERLLLPTCEHVTRVPAQDGIGERIWLRLDGRLLVEYSTSVTVTRLPSDFTRLDSVPPHRLPGETVQYLMGSRYCPSDRFHSFVEATFGTVANGTMLLAMRDWVRENLQYVSGSSDGQTTAADTFISRQGVCRDYAHLLITFARAAGIPARIASVYAPAVDPPDFHAVAEVYLDGDWHLIDATGMADELEIAKIGIGRDAVDVAFLTAFGEARFNAQSVEVLTVD